MRYAKFGRLSGTLCKRVKQFFTVSKAVGSEVKGVQFKSKVLHAHQVLQELEPALRHLMLRKQHSATGAAHSAAQFSKHTCWVVQQTAIQTDHSDRPQHKLASGWRAMQQSHPKDPHGWTDILTNSAAQPYLFSTNTPASCTMTCMRAPYLCQYTQEQQSVPIVKQHGAHSLQHIATS